MGWRGGGALEDIWDGRGGGRALGSERRGVEMRVQGIMDRDGYMGRCRLAC